MQIMENKESQLLAVRNDATMADATKEFGKES
jgi:hypothetical protein